MDDDLLKKLSSLAQLDTDAVSVYTEAISHVSDAAVRRQFEDFRSEHEYHASELGKAVVRLGGQPLDLEVDLLGRVADWVTALRARSGTEGSLKAMHTAEEYHNRRYTDAVEWDVEDAELAGKLRAFLADEKRHLAFVESRLAAGPDA